MESERNFDNENEEYLEAGELEVVEIDEEEPIDLDDDEEEGQVEGDEMDIIANENELDIEVNDISNYTFKSHTKSVYSVALHPTIYGLVATGGEDDKAYLWFYDSNQKLNPEINEFSWFSSSSLILEGHSDTITSVGFNFNGSCLLTASYDGTIKIWEVKSGNLLQTLEGPEDIEWACWHSKGNAVLGGSKDGTIWMWLAHNGQCMQVFAGHDGLVSCGSFCQEGKSIVSAGEDGTIRLWNPRNGACKFVFEEKLGHEGSITCVSAYEDYILTGSEDGTSKLYQISGNKLLHTFIHSAIDQNDESVASVECVGFSETSLKWVATGGLDNNLIVWEISTGSKRAVCPHQDGVVALKWHPSHPFIISGSLDRNARLWDARSGDCLSIFSGHLDLITNISFQKYIVDDQQREVLVTVSDDFTAKIFFLDPSLV